MHIMVITDRFAPEITAVSVRTVEHARVWLEDGHQVTIVTCAPNFPKGELFPGYRNKLYQEEWVDGIKVVRLWSYLAPNTGVFRRTLDYFSFTLSAILQTRRLPNADVIVATSPPIFTALAGRVIASLKRRPWVFELRDLWPATIHAVEATKSPLLRLVEKLEMSLYAHATRVMALTRAFRHDLITRGVPEAKISVVTNGVNQDTFSSRRCSYDARERLGIDKECFLTGYIGTIGMAHGLECLINAAEKCEGDSNIKFLVMGEGAERAKIENLARDKGLSNVVFQNFVPHDQVINYLSALDVAIVHLRPHPLFRTVIPSKIFENMAMGKPIILAVEGESAEIVQQAGCGILVPPGDADALADAVQQLSTDPEQLRQLGEAGKTAAREQFDRRVLARAALKCLEQAVADHAA